MQLHGYQHTTYPDDTPLNKDDHHHVHQAMTAQEQRSVLEETYGKKGHRSALPQQ